MAYSMTASGVQVTGGRGKGAVSLVVSFREIERWAKKMRKDTKELWRLSYGRACAGLKKKFLEVMRQSGGVNGVPKFKDFEDFTKALRSAGGRTAPMGGMLADKSVVVAFKRNGAQVIGWPITSRTPRARSRRAAAARTRKSISPIRSGAASGTSGD